jgi:hypothetical protein
MIHAAIVGVGWWGRMLVNAVQGKSAAIRFTAGYTRTHATAEGFCAEHSIALANDLRNPALSGGSLQNAAKRLHTRKLSPGSEEDQNILICVKQVALRRSASGYTPLPLLL